MKTDWNYTSLAKAYLKRPDYAPDVIDRICRAAGLHAEHTVADIGAGVAHLTRMLAERDFQVTAIEPNDAMRALGIQRTASFSNVAWVEAIAEQTKQNDHSFDLVTFGSSFNVTERSRALQETARILRPSGWFACLWNHRVLSDPLQAEIESTIRRHVPNYNYGVRREDQGPLLRESGLFSEVTPLSAPVVHTQSIDDCLEAWRSHATLARQAGEHFPQVVQDIERLLEGRSEIQVPYETRGWMAQLKPQMQRQVA